MRRVSTTVPLSVLRNLYYALIFPWLTYALCTWGSAYPTTSRRLTSLVEKALTLVTDYMNQDHIPKTVERSPLQHDDVYRYLSQQKRMI